MKEPTENIFSPKTLIATPLVRFLLKLGLMYIVWEVLNSFSQRIILIKGIWDNIHKGMMLQIVDISEFILGSLLQYPLEVAYDTIRVVGSAGVRVGPACVGFGLQVAFITLILAYHGPWKRKLWFIPLGMVGIHFINVLRVVILAIISHINNDWVDFNHKYVFSSMVYLFIFVMWVTWVRAVEKENPVNPEQAQST